MVRVDRNREGDVVSQRNLMGLLLVSIVGMSMSQDGPENPAEQSLHGAVVHPNSEQELLKVIESAFGYRGDIMLELKSRECINGYLFNRVFDGPHSYVEIFQPDQAGPRRIPCHEIHAFHFTGHDTASGKSWEAWVQTRRQEK